jgi:hypothetical protein
MQSYKDHRWIVADPDVLKGNPLFAARVFPCPSCSLAWLKE